MGRVDRADALRAAHVPDQHAIDVELQLREAGLRSRLSPMMPTAWVVLGIGVVIAVLVLVLGG